MYIYLKLTKTVCEKRGEERRGETHLRPLSLHLWLSSLSHNNHKESIHGSGSGLN